MQSVFDSLWNTEIEASMETNNVVPLSTEQLGDIHRALRYVDPRGYLSLNNASRYLDTLKAPFVNMCDSGRFPALNRGRKLKFKVRELDQWMERHRVRGPTLR
jgi:hypothetical protein